jgi:hypothetical protein
MNDAPTPDAFATLRDLLALAVDPAATRSRLAKLEKALEQTEAAEQRLAERSAAFDQKVATEKASLDERKAALDKRALQLSHREAAAEQIIQRDRAARLGRSRPLANGMTIVQETP